MKTRMAYRENKPKGIGSAEMRAPEEMRGKIKGSGRIS